MRQPNVWIFAMLAIWLLCHMTSSPVTALPLEHHGPLPERIYMKTPSLDCAIRQATESEVTGTKSKFGVTYLNLPGSGFQAAIEYALLQVANVFPSSVEINTRIQFQESNPDNLTMEGETSQFFLLEDGVYYQMAMAESIRFENLNTVTNGDAAYDVLLTIYTTGVSWYLTTDGMPSDEEYDLATFVIHHTLHALFFSGLIQVDAQAVWGGFPQGRKASFDLYLTSPEGCAIYGYTVDPNSTTNAQIGATVTSSNLSFSTVNGKIVDLYAPSPYQQGISVYHYDPAHQGADNTMQPEIPTGFKQHSVGQFATTIMNLILNRSADTPNPCEPTDVAETFTVVGAASTFRVAYVNLPDTSYQTAVEYALLEIAKVFPSTIPIDILVQFSSGNPDKIPATGKPGGYVPIDGVHYQLAVAESLRKENLNNATSGDQSYDVLLTIFMEGNQWYTGTTGSPDYDEYDLVTIVLHETIHGLFFSGLLYIDSGPVWGGWPDGAKSSFDFYLAAADGCAIYGYSKSSGDVINSEIGKSVTNNELYFTDDSDRIVQLYAPSAFSERYSIYHVDPAQFSDIYASDSDTLMIPNITINTGMKQHDLGRFVIDIMNLIVNGSLATPPACTPGSYEENQPGDPNDIAGLPEAAFWAIIGVSCGIFVIIVTAITVYTWWRIRSRKRAKAQTSKSKSRRPDQYVTDKGADVDGTIEEEEVASGGYTSEPGVEDHDQYHDDHKEEYQEHDEHEYEDEHGDGSDRAGGSEAAHDTGTDVGSGGGYNSGGGGSGGGGGGCD